MHKSNLLKTTVLASFLIAMNAQAFEIGKKPTTAYATITTATLAAHQGARKSVTLMSIKLSDQEMKNISDRIRYSSLTVPSTSDAKLPSKIDIGMGTVPVLNQGKHGSCATFANTAALAAHLHLRGDYISQLCHLELGNYLEKNGYIQAGWEGSTGPIVLSQLERFGYVSKDKEKAGVCAGVTQYPDDDENNIGKPMSLEAYKAVSENPTAINEEGQEYTKWTWAPIMNSIDRINAKFENENDAKAALIEIKKSLVKGNHVTVGALILTAPQCNSITCATYKRKNDTWSLTNDIKYSGIFKGGHEMVIVGYNDNVEKNDYVTDNDGTKKRGVLILRNSWGTDTGDRGNFYMTYEYFIALATEAQKIMPNLS